MSRAFVYLASGSPRRRQLLRQIGVEFQVLKVEIDESIGAGEGALEYVTRLARAKAAAGARLVAAEVPTLAREGAGPRGTAMSEAKTALVLGADTAVVVDGAILGKPADAEDGERMLRLLSGRTHDVLTAVALASAHGVTSCVSASEVTFRDIGAAEAHEYRRSAEPADKAGGYAIQGYGAVFVSRLAGSYSGVMGLPLFETAELLRGAGVTLRWESRGEH
jgi:septum formation protein